MADEEGGGLEAHLAAVRARALAGLPARAARLVSLADRVAVDDTSAHEELLREVHKLRGLGGSIGRADLSERAARLEDAMRKGVSALATAEGTRRLAALIATPATTAPATGPAPTTQAASPRRPTRLDASVLVIDDELATRQLLVRLLAAAGCEVRETEDPEVLVREAVARRPDLAILDAMMPTATGLDLYRALRALPGPPVRVVILSAASAEDLGWTLPADPRLRWMQKPFRPDALLASLRAFLQPER